MPPKSSAEGISLGDLLAQIRSDLEASARERGPNWTPVFQLKEAVVEIAIGVSRNKAVKGGFSVFAAEIGAQGDEGSTHQHRLSVSLIPAKSGSVRKGTPTVLLAGDAPTRRKRSRDK